MKFLKLKKEKHPQMGHYLEYVEKRNAVAVCVFTHDLKNVVLVNQYRVGSKKRLMEIPAGLIEDSEDKLEAMYRELREETGYSKEDIKN